MILETTIDYFIPETTGANRGMRHNCDRMTVLEELVCSFRQDLERYARKACSNEQDWEDAFEDAMLAALRYIPEFRGEAHLKTWLYKLASSACSRMRRGKKNDPLIHEEADSQSLGEEAGELAPPEALLAMKEEFAELFEAMHHIPREDRALLIAHEMDGESLKTLAQRTGRSESSIKSRMYRARKRLYVLLEERGVTCQTVRG